MAMSPLESKDKDTPRWYSQISRSSVMEITATRPRIGAKQPQMRVVSAPTTVVWVSRANDGNHNPMPTSSASASQCRGCGRYPSRIRPAYQRDTPIRFAMADAEARASAG